MTGCPSRAEWLRQVDGEVTANRAAELDAHRGTCVACRSERDALAALVRDLRAPAGPPGPWMVARVMAHLDRAVPPAPARRWPLAAVIAAAAAVGLAVIAWPSASGDFQSRGIGGARGIDRVAGIELYALGGALDPLGDRAVVTSATAYVGSYRNLGSRAAYALVFAIDSTRELHWLYPAFTDPASDPEAVSLGTARDPTLLAESVALDHPSPGALTFVIVVDDHPLHVSDIERLRPEARTVAALRARWPSLRAITVTVRDP
jgi:hypothetical protein